jgi:hypothetical protein
MLKNLRGSTSTVILSHLEQQTAFRSAKLKHEFKLAIRIRGGRERCVGEIGTVLITDSDSDSDSAESDLKAPRDTLR